MEYLYFQWSYDAKWLRNMIDASGDVFDHPIEADENGLGHLTVRNDNGLDIDPQPIILTYSKIS